MLFKNYYLFLDSIKDILVKRYSIQGIKMFFLSFYFFLVFGSYTLFKDLKDSIFMITVGTKYIPEVKVISLFLMIPLVIIYSWLSNKISRTRLMIIYAIIYGFGGILLSILLNHPTIGLMNTIASKFRWFGWGSYLFLEGASPFLVGLSWSFLSSISHPRDVKKSYMMMTIMSKVGGAFFASVGWFLSYYLSFSYDKNADVFLYSFMMKFAALSTLLLTVVIILMTYILPSEEFVGYNKEDDLKKSEQKKHTRSFGLFTLLKNRYVLGIFGMVFFWEIINFIFNNLRLNVAFNSSETIAHISAYLLKSTIFMHLTGLFFAIFGTSFFVNTLGERKSLLLIPISTGIIIFTFLFSQNPTLITIVYPFIGAINYSLSRPLRESLFIVTSKNIQFSTKQWIDSFGQKFFKNVWFNVYYFDSAYFSEYYISISNRFFCIVIFFVDFISCFFR